MLKIEDNRRRSRPSKLVTREQFFQRMQRPVDCWLYDGAKEINGYGYLTNPIPSGARYITAHKLAWIFTHGSVPKGMLVLHRCDIRACCNPEHLFLGTNADNTADKMYKERYQGKLTAAQVREIRTLFPTWKFGMGKEVARKYGVSEVVICKLRQGETYQHVT